MAYTEKSYDNIKPLCYSKCLLIVTATDIETKSLHSKLQPLAGNPNLLKVYNGNQTYYIGQFGAYTAVHVQCGMGSVSRDSSLTTVKESIASWKPRVALMVGIAFGIDDDKQKIGDVLVSNAIIPYNYKKITEEGIVEQRALTMPASKVLVNRFKNLRTWEFPLQLDEKASVFIGPVLSGEELINNLKHRDALKSQNSTAIGGEMEGAGVCTACDSECDWIIVKGICDFADGNKNIDKDSNQEIAASVSVSICLDVFSSPNAFKALELPPVDADIKAPEELSISPEEVNNILFDIYDETKEPFYHERTIDEKVVKCLELYNIWLSGPTGCGKSNLIYRNLSKSGHKLIQVSLASCIGLTNDDFFDEIIAELSMQFWGTTATPHGSFKEKVHHIIQLLKDISKGNDIFIFIDEIPLGNEQQFKDFIEKFIALYISKTLIVDLSKIKFILSTIINPLHAIPEFQQKVHQQMKFLPLDYWEDKDTEALVKLISEGLRLPLDEDIVKELITKAKGSPRFIKKFFRNILTYGKFDKDSILMMIAETDRELRSI